MLKLLICDDSTFQRNFVKDLLSASGYNFVEASDGNEVLKITEDEKFDCILLDLLMPNKDGVEVLKELKSRGNTIPVIVLSANIQESSKQECFDLGASMYLNKPPQADELNAAIRKVTGKEE